MEYDTNIFINCPFDPTYKPLLDALIFTISDAGFTARSALELTDSSVNRLEKILAIMEDCRLSVHDISRTEPNEHGFPRFNMPFELGLFLGAKRFGTPRHAKKACLILDRDQYRYKEFLSDVGGHDIESHKDSPEILVRRVRDWLAQQLPAKVPIPGGTRIWKRYQEFRRSLPALCAELGIEENEMIFRDYTYAVFEWIKTTALPSSLAALAPAHLWIALKNTNDIGTRFDVRVEALKNSATVATGLTLCRTVVRNLPGTKMAIPISLPSDVPLVSGDVLAVRISARIGTPRSTCGGHSTATGLRLYYDSTKAPSHLGVTISPSGQQTLYLHSDGNACSNTNFLTDSTGVTTRFLSDSLPTATDPKCKDVGTLDGRTGNPFVTIGTWSLTLQ
jgi:hypothetical protein